jgi:hypothetical protein
LSQQGALPISLSLSLSLKISCLGYPLYRKEPQKVSLPTETGGGLLVPFNNGPGV